jgi:hypothetical protein
LAASRAAWTAGSSSAISTAMIAITTSSSISVKPRARTPGVTRFREVMRSFLGSMEKMMMKVDPDRPMRPAKDAPGLADHFFGAPWP